MLLYIELRVGQDQKNFQQISFIQFCWFLAGTEVT